MIVYSPRWKEMYSKTIKFISKYLRNSNTYVTLQIQQNKKMMKATYTLLNLHIIIRVVVIASGGERGSCV